MLSYNSSNYFRKKLFKILNLIGHLIYIEPALVLILHLLAQRLNKLTNFWQPLIILKFYFKWFTLWAQIAFWIVIGVYLLFFFFLLLNLILFFFFKFKKLFLIFWIFNCFFVLFTLVFFLTFYRGFILKIFIFMIFFFVLNLRLIPVFI